jgi:uncharacterized protein YndB with AHSA1/START domain
MAGLRNLVVHLERLVPAPRAVVFAAHAVPNDLAKWWGPEGFSAPSVELDVRPGGRFRIAMQPPEGDVFHLSGQFREVEEPSRLTYTFRYDEPDPDDRETVVTFSLQDADDSTIVVVDQGVFATEARRALHEQGWRETLDRLERLMSGGA